MGEYKLSASLTGHEDDVRAVSFPSPTTVLSASRDATVRHWKLTSPSPPTYDPSIAYTGNTFINALASAPPSPSLPDGLIISGGKDTIIDVRPPGRPPEADAERLLLGHQGNVCAFDVDPQFEKSKVLVSGSWDASALVWDVEKGEVRATLGEHGGSVWAVLVYDQNVVITACADSKIRLWTPTGKLMKTIPGGAEPVRALCRLPQGSAAQFASAGNDGVIRLWTLEGEEVAQLHGHENFVYSLACLPNGDLISSSEDRTVRIWHGTECTQTITHPAISVWSVAVCAENGDIVTGASDKTVRVFSRDPNRHADEATLKAFIDSVQGSAIPQQQTGVNKKQLPGPEFLQQKSGTKEGQVQMIKETNGGVTAHQWSSATSEWISVGTVVDSQGSSGRKHEYMGQDYDYVFDVDIEDGKPPLKLPYNLSQNAYEVAQKWISDNELPASYVDQVANFILENTQGATLGQQSQGAGGAAGSDPWGSENRYRPGETAPPAPKPKVIPQKDYLFITTASYAPMFKKITEVNDKLASDDSTRKLAIPGAATQFLPNISKELETALPSSSQPKPTDSKFLQTGITIAHHIITTWPPADRVPGLDLYRLLTAASPGIVGENRDFLQTLTATNALPTTSTSSKPDPDSPIPTANTTMLALRSLVNLFAHAPGRELLASNFSTIWSLVSPFLSQPSTSSQSLISEAIRTNRNVHIAGTTIGINYAVLCSQFNASSPELSSHAGGILQDLTAFVTDPKIVDGETVYRALVAIGTLMSDAKLVDVKGDETLKAVLRRALDKVEKGAKEPRIKGAVGECRSLLS